MCGRFAITLPDDAVARLFSAAPDNDLPPVPRHNVCPTQPVAAVVAEAAGRRLRALRWGFVPRWARSLSDGPLLINARAETLAEKPAFAEAARTRRCLIPATGFYEWTKDESGARLPWFARPCGAEVAAFAGIWQVWTSPDGESLATCAIVTTAAGPDLAAIHHRAPLALAPGDWALWLGEAGKGAARLMRPAPAGAWDVWRVDPRVNSNRAEGPDLMVPLAAGQGGAQGAP
ncbi:MAG: SOS response-associated peptidase [Rhodobacteraceae bacterium]|nr:SOS response-associated peptidase [Paracoccaceae bacterium]